MTIRTVLRTRILPAITAAVALAVMPAAAAIHAQDPAPAAVGASVVADATVTPAPASTDTTRAVRDTGARRLSTPAGLDDTTTSQPERVVAQSEGGSVPTDESGSTEAQEVQRNCDAAADPHYVPSSGRDSDECYDSDGDFQPGWTYTATHYSNDVECGEENQITGELFTNTWLYGAADADGGYVGVCASEGMTSGDDGRVTVTGDTDGSAEVVADGDKDNPEETTQGWASVTVSPDGATYRCGKSYADGGRGTADAPTDEDNAEQCG